MKHLTQIEELAACSIFNDPGEIALNYFFSTLAKLRTLRCIDLSINRLEASQSNSLFAQLSQMKSLNTLVLS
jgi:hypothetical protein